MYICLCICIHIFIHNRGGNLSRPKHYTETTQLVHRDKKCGTESRTDGFARYTHEGNMGSVYAHGCAFMITKISPSSVAAFFPF